MKTMNLKIDYLINYKITIQTQKHLNLNIILCTYNFVHMGDP